MLWKTSPAATELEVVVLDWLRQAIGLPPGLFGVIQDTASSATLVALAAAREAVPGPRRRGGAVSSGRRGCACTPPSTRIPRSRRRASSSASGRTGLRKVPVDAAFRMDVDALRAAIAEDRAAGFTPFAVTATVGTTSTTSIDPVPAIAEVARARRPVAARRRRLRGQRGGRARSCVTSSPGATARTRWS